MGREEHDLKNLKRSPLATDFELHLGMILLAFYSNILLTD